MLGSILKIFVYLISGLLFLIIGFIGGYLIYLKIKHPDFTFMELIEEEKAKFFGEGATYNVENNLGKTTPSQSQTKVDQKPKQQTQSSNTNTSSTVVKDAKPQSQNNEEDTSANVPEWLKQAQQKTKPAQETISPKANDLKQKDLENPKTKSKIVKASVSTPNIVKKEIRIEDTAQKITQIPSTSQQNQDLPDYLKSFPKSQN